jgi:hypothetical protein
MRTIRLLQCVLLLVPALSGSATQTPLGEEQARAFKSFNTLVQQYVKLRKGVESSLPPLRPTKEAPRIAVHQHELATKVAQARSGAHQGDIFTPEVTTQFREIIRLKFKGPSAPLARKTIRPDEPSKPVYRLKVNDVYPENMQLTTMPPTLLSKLPQLPQELEYRIVSRDFVLLDTKASIVVDLIPSAIP